MAQYTARRGAFKTFKASRLINTHIDIDTFVDPVSRLSSTHLT